MSVFSNPITLTDVKTGQQFELAAGNIVKVSSQNIQFISPFLFPTSSTLTTNNITAHAGGGQQTGSLLSTEFNSISTVATTADSVTLPAATLNTQYVIYNGGALTMDIYPYTSGTINGGSANAAITLAAGTGITLVASSALNWNTTYPSLVYFLDNRSTLAKKIVYEDAGIISYSAESLISVSALVNGYANIQNPVYGTLYINPNYIENYLPFTVVLSGPASITSGALTAHAGGGQQTSGASLLVATNTYNIVTTVATAADSVTLPAATVGGYMIVQNLGANNLSVYAFTSGTINSGSSNGFVTVAPGAQTIFTGSSSTNWTTSTPVLTKILYNTQQDADETYLVTNSTSAITAAINLLLSGSGGAAVNYTPTAVNATATLTAAQVAGGYITVVSTSAVALTMPTGTLLGAAVNAKQGTQLRLTIDNTGSSSSGIVTMAVGTNAVQSDWDNQITTATASVTPSAVTPLTITYGVSGIGQYLITFSSGTAYVFSRTA